ncbi:iron siderophore/cobalamin ABC transporter periplasmic iron siderophore/cobalamin-binding protein [Rhodovulum sulfidophilum]|uniref:Iron siderophore/cobalamin ABC transporter periplasmic iron siderophore/cobalamin-binding protein n=1 Tax=Rhodovulum sulfidophilum TaxID=35806 RepID=A0A0D6B7K9_RHOSU|nr:iron siderophore/cobalamin ABC transporter periplasmic iron siderophore/cobalamin-binding protein [Rhodovulum sulfidophilum]
MNTKTALLSAAMLVCAGTAQATDYPLTLENCGQTLTFDAAPARTVTVGQGTTEILYLLGLGPTVKATSVWFTDVLPQFAELNAGIARLADNDPSFESVAAEKPDLVTVQYEWHVGAQGIVATREMFHDIGVPTYVLPSDCTGKDNSRGSDGTRTEMFSTASIYRSFEELARIYDVEDRGAELVGELKARETAAIQHAQALDLPEGASAVFWYSSAEMDIDPYVAGQKGAPGYMMQELGIENVVASDEEWPTVGWESIAKADPTVIVLAEMTRRRFPADDVEKKLEFLRTDPVAKEMTAVRENRIVVMDAQAMDATVRAIYGLEELSAALAGFDLQG